MLLLERSYQHIFKGTQVGPEFIPETFLPSYTRAVDPEHFVGKLKQSPNPEELNKFRGTFAERIFYDSLKAELMMKSSIAIVLEGFQMMLPEILRKPGSQAGGRQESDFLIINQEYQYVMSLEVKYNLHAITDSNREASIKKGTDQITNKRMTLRSREA